MKAPRADIWLEILAQVCPLQKESQKHVQDIQGPKRRERVTTAAPQGKTSRILKNMCHNAPCPLVVSLASFLDTSESNQIVQMLMKGKAAACAFSPVKTQHH